MALTREPPPPKLEGQDFVLARIALRDAWLRLVAAADTLAERMGRLDADLPAYCAPNLYGTEARIAAIKIYRDMKHRNDGDGTTTSYLPGIVCASKLTLRAAAAVNDAKQDLRAAIAAIPKAQQAIALRGINQARLHRKQAYRIVKILGSYTNPELPAPVGVGWSWTKKVADYQIVNLAVLETDLRTGAAGDERSQKDLERLRALPRGHRLVYVRPGSVHLLNNVSYPPKNPKKSKRKVLRPIFSSIPLLVASTELPECDEFTKLKEEYERERARRSDARLDAEPYLETMPRIFREVPNRVPYRERKERVQSRASATGV